MPLDTNQNDSWKDNSSDKDATNAKSFEHTSDLFIHNNIPSSTDVSPKLAHKRRKQKEYESQITVFTGILPKRTRMSMKKKMQLEKAQVHSVY